MSDQAFQIIGWIVAILALGMLLAALFKDWLRQRLSRSKRRRCPKCWYDLSHTAGRTCSECGHAATHERNLFKSRRQWKLVGLAMVLMLASHAISVTPAVKQRGWVAAVPTPAMILMLPHLRPDRNCVVRNRSTATATWNQQAKVPTWKELLFIDLVHRRFQNGSVGWLNDLLIKVVVSDPKYTYKDQVYRWPTARDHFLALQRWSDGKRIAWKQPRDIHVRTVLRTRPRWPANVPLFAHAEIVGNALSSKAMFISQQAGLTSLTRSDGMKVIACGPNPSPSKWRDGLEQISARPMREIEYAVHAEHHEVASELWVSRSLEYPTKSVRLPVEIVDSCEQILTRVTSPDLDRFLAQLRPTLQNTGGSFGIRLNGDRSLPSHPYNREKLTLAFALKVWRGDEIVATGFAWYWHGDFAMVERTYIALVPSSGADVGGSNAYRDWRLTLTGDPLIALRNFDCNRYWHGEITLPLEVVNQ